MSTAAAYPSIDDAGRAGYKLPNVDLLRPTAGVAPTSGIQGTLDAIKNRDDWAVHAAEALLKAALDAGCSDLHLSSLRNELLVRGRREGTLFELAHIAPEHRDLLIARMKVLAHVPTFVRHEPQDGRIEWRVADGQPPMVFRASFLPTLHGESVVIRLPECREAKRLGLDELGLREDVREALLGLLARREGVLVLTGPSSSGKTTTMYAMLERLHATHGDRLNVLTIEDPVERDLGFASQVPINNAQGLTFERALRAAVRQDPNVLMVGEVRDSETARTAVQAGMSGHLVITTMHAGRASRVFTRLLSMGMEPYLVGSALSGAIAQRLVRKICSGCRGAGCVECNKTGSIGRTGIFEVVTVTERLRELMLAKASVSEIAAEAARNMVGDLFLQGQQMVANGEISGSEFQFVLCGEDDPS